MSEGSNDKELIAGVFGQRPEHLANLLPSRKRKYEPWHRVRKQFIREKQWNHQVGMLIDRILKHELAAIEETVAIERNDEGDDGKLERMQRPLRCLVLPGRDMLDIRSLWRALEARKCHLKYFGFNTASDAQVAENEVRALSRVAADSLVLSDPFQSIAGDKHPAFETLKRYGPYDVVNLDFCDTLLPDSIEDMAANQYYQALYRLVGWQILKRTDPWLLFLTTRLDAHAINEQGAAKLVGQPLMENCRKHQEFKTALAGTIPHVFSRDNSLPNLHAMPMEQLTKCYAIMLGKWLMKMGGSGSTDWCVELLTSYSYVSEPQGGATMLSLAYRFVRRDIPPVNPSNDVLPVEEDVDWEKQLGLDMIRHACRISDVDMRLAADDNERQQMKAASISLMVEAGYPEDEYIEFLSSKGE